MSVVSAKKIELLQFFESHNAKPNLGWATTAVAKL